MKAATVAKVEGSNTRAKARARAALNKAKMAQAKKRARAKAGLKKARLRNNHLPSASKR
jgi:hypothetical protein